MSEAKLGSFLQEVSNMRWDEFWAAERDKSYSSNQAIILSLIRSCTLQKMPAIKMALNRLDGKLVTPVKIEYPKIFYLYPNAKQVEAHTDIHVGITAGDIGSDIVQRQDTEEPEEVDLPSLSLRETLTKMSDYPRSLPENVIDLARATEESLREQKPLPSEIPMVKSVVAAHLLIMAQNQDTNAIAEVFDQIDGKLAETIKLLGDDIYITSYIDIAPANAYVNKDGILQAEAEQVQAVWAAKLGKVIDL